MNAKDPSRREGKLKGNDRSQLGRYLWGALVAWTAVVALSLGWNLSQAQSDMLELARLQARVAYDKDIIYRRWNTDRSPVYVRESPEAPPNPYLSDLDERDVTTPSSTRLTLMNPAYMTRQAHELGEEAYGVRGHITSLTPIRAENAPDLWEAEALKSFESGRSESSSVEQMDGQDYMRLMRPLITEQRCLKCHEAQGYRVGDIRGGISVSVPMAPLLAVAGRYATSLMLGHGLVWAVGIMGIMLAGLRLRASRQKIKAQNVELAVRNQELQEAYGRLDREFRTVGEVQVSLLPSKSPEITGVEIATFYKPATQAGGDYFDFFALPESEWGFIVADVSGHGTPAAVVMAITRAILHLSKELAPPHEVLARLNMDLSENLMREQFLTACYGVLDPATATFTLASAGHPPPLCFDPKSGSTKALEVETGLPLGVDFGAAYEAYAVRLEPDSLLLFYTDGITEAQNADGEMFGQARLEAVLEASHASPARVLVDGIMKSLNEYRGQVELGDDVTLLAVRIQAK